MSLYITVVAGEWISVFVYNGEGTRVDQCLCT